jgi:hypothetical protein
MKGAAYQDAFGGGADLAPSGWKIKKRNADT